MSADIMSLDHPVLAVRDLDRSREAFLRMGFTVPPRGVHLEWGTGNWCIMFKHDYLELRGIIDASKYTHHLDRFLGERGEGIMGVAFAPNISAQASEMRARESGLHPIGVKQLTRRFECPEGALFPKFNILYLDDAELPELHTTVVCEHLTPELIRRPEWLRHANGVLGVKSLIVAVAEPAALRGRYERFFGSNALELDRGRLIVRPPQGARIEFLNENDARHSGFLIGATTLPAICSLTFAVASVAETARVLSANAVAWEWLTDRSLRVSPMESCGATLFFEDGE